ncbi:hypothetical protein PanWU01x14_290170 [Parasponia andersonii]|uniref:Uncharacterized protein n=1 Tax=Parasponia andersonii TaxID=3476 RepID=A0A2P5AXW0_PARAD|nr:hypothetical protein PanWU01x14_290170 [Parasponia andersonii]
MAAGKKLDERMDAMEGKFDIVHMVRAEEINLVRRDICRLPALEKRVKSIIGKLNHLLSASTHDTMGSGDST